MAEPWVALAAIAAATSRVRIGPLVTPLPRRRPWNVARQVVSLDYLSAGRVTLGIGLGVSAGPEFRDFGEESDPRRRGDQLDEGLEIIRRCWTGDPVSFDGQHYQVGPVRFLPEPLQRTVPVWGATERTSGRAVRRAAQLNGVFPFGLSPAQLPELLASISALRAGGPDGYDVVVAGGADDDWRRWRDAGATWWLRVLPWRRPLAESVAAATAGPPS